MTASQDLMAQASFRPSPGKALVVLVALGWLLLASPWPASLNGSGIVVLLALAALDILLGTATGWLAFKPSSRLDEREEELRNRAYRIGFRLIAVGILVMFALVTVGSIATGPNVDESQIATQLPDGFSGRTIAALVEMLVILPTAVVAWLEPDMELRLLRPRQWLPLVAVPSLGLLWLGVMTLVPVQLVTRVGSNGGFSLVNASCEHYAAEQRVGPLFGGAARVGAEVCWNGTKAFVVGDPSLTPPGANLSQEDASVPRLPDLVSCMPQPGDRDFATVSQQCTELIDNQGTMHLVMRSTVSPLPGGIGVRHLRMELVVDHSGNLVSFQ